MIRLLRRAPEPPSIYEHVRAHVLPGVPGLADGGAELPDDDLVAERGLRWAPGALEGAFYRYGGEAEQPDVGALHAALVHLAERPSQRTRRRVRALFRDSEPRPAVDPLLARLRARPPARIDVVYDELRSLLLTSGRRNEVKFALAIVGAFGEERDAEVFRTLARHDEFTLYAAIALAAVVDDPDEEWRDLLAHVTGWGRTELSELLLRDDAPEETRDALLRRGLGVGNALLLASGAGLDEALAAPQVDDELLEAAREIIDALVWQLEQPESLVDWPDAGPAVESFLEHLEPRASTLDHFLSVGHLRAAVTAEDAEELERAGFDELRRERVAARCDAILERPEWPWLARRSAESDRPEERWRGIEAGKHLGLPLRDLLVHQLERHPYDASLWYELVGGADEAQLDEALGLADRLVDLDALAVGPGLEIFAPGRVGEVSTIVDWLLQELERFPGRGERVLLAALRSPVVRNRLWALRVVSLWDAPTPPLRRAAETCRRDPDGEVRAAAAAVLRGESIPERSVE